MLCEEGALTIQKMQMKMFCILKGKKVGGFPKVFKHKGLNGPDVSILVGKEVALHLLKHTRKIHRI